MNETPRIGIPRQNFCPLSALMTETRTHSEIDRSVALDAIETVLDEAMHAADLVAAFLRERGVLKRDPVQLPPELLLALGNALRMEELNRASVGQVPCQSTSSVVPAGQLLQDHLAGGQVAEVESPTAWEFVLTKFAHHGRRVLGADLTQDITIPDEFVELLADFLWNHRHGHQE